MLNPAFPPFFPGERSVFPGEPRAPPGTLRPTATAAAPDARGSAATRRRPGERRPGQMARKRNSRVMGPAWESGSWDTFVYSMCVYYYT